MNPNKFYTGNTGSSIKLTPEDTKMMEKMLLKGMGLIDITKSLKIIHDSDVCKEFSFRLDERFIRDNFINNFLGECVEEYDANFNKHMETCTFLNTACNYQSMKKFLFYFETSILCDDNNDFNKKYNVEISAKGLDTPPSIDSHQKIRFTTFYQGGCLFFNIFYNNLLLSMELFALWLLEFIIDIKISERQK